MDYDLAAELHATSLKVHELAAQVQLLVQEERPEAKIRVGKVLHVCAGSQALLD